MSHTRRWLFLIDENLPQPMAEALRSAGYLAEHVVEAGLTGHPDADIFAYAQAHQQTIITNDLGLANVIAFPPPHGGIIALRLPNSVQTSDRIQRLVDALPSLSGQDLSSVVVVVDQRRVRVRR
jgi:predicted nuclease of predicted toxin-antitoxin system